MLLPLYYLRLSVLLLNFSLVTFQHLPLSVVVFILKKKNTQITIDYAMRRFIIKWIMTSLTDKKLKGLDIDVLCPSGEKTNAICKHYPDKIIQNQPVINST